jgi:hypothetical protein
MQINVQNAESMNIGIHLILDGVALTVIIELTIGDFLGFRADSLSARFTPKPKPKTRESFKNQQKKVLLLVIRLFDNAHIIIGTLGLVNALVCLGVGLYFYSVDGMATLLSLFLIPEGLVMLCRAYCLYNSRYVIGGLLILVPSLYAGYVSWVQVFQYLLHVPDEISWGLAFAIPISTSAMAFLIRIRDWHDAPTHKQ